MYLQVNFRIYISENINSYILNSVFSAEWKNLRVVAIISILAIIVAIGAISQNRAIKKAEALQAQIQEVNTADWYLCGKDLTVYTRLEEIYAPMDRMILRSGRAVQVVQIEVEWVTIKSQAKIGYIRRGEFDEFFLKISLNIG